MKTKNDDLCKWTGESGYDIYDTSCGQAWQFLEGDLRDNKIVYCPFCGKKIEDNTLKCEDED